MSLKLALYNRIINRSPVIKLRYEQYAIENSGKKLLALRKALCITKLYGRYYLLGDKQLESKNRKKPCTGCESEETFRLPPRELAEKLGQSDVVSFDVFDTLILRPFSDPKDLFYIVGERLDYPNFRTIRASAEKKARQKYFEQNGSYEIDIQDIYEMLSVTAGIDADSGVSEEVSAELELCYANPYMKKVYDLLIAKGKTVIITTDMYLKREHIEQLLNKNGYYGYDRIYLSCENKLNKCGGTVWKQIRSDYAQAKTFAHIGDNRLSDVKTANANGFQAYYYENVNLSGGKHRPDMSPLIGSAYSGIVNARLHSGNEHYSLQYEYGYICGGILMTGFASFVHKTAKERNADIVLFFSRDGYIMEKIYNKLFPEEKTAYVYWSRAAAAKLGYEKFRADYYRRFIYHKRSSLERLEDIFSAMELDCADFGLDGGEILSKANADRVVAALNKNRDIILSAYEQQQEGARSYYSEVLNGSKTAVCADCGWAGSGYIILDYLVREKWRLGTQLYGVIAAANSRYQYDSDYSEMYFRRERLKSYCFSSDFNRRLYEHHNPGAGHNIYFELLMSAPQPSFTGFSYENGKYRLNFDNNKESEKTYEIIGEIHRGIQDFTDDYMRFFGKYSYMLNISGQDAYAPFGMYLDGAEKHLRTVLGECDFSTDVSGKKQKINKG